MSLTGIPPNIDLDFGESSITYKRHSTFTEKNDTNADIKLRTKPGFKMQKNRKKITDSSNIPSGVANKHNISNLKLSANPHRIYRSGNRKRKNRDKVNFNSNNPFRLNIHTTDLSQSSTDADITSNSKFPQLNIKGEQHTLPFQSNNAIRLKSNSRRQPLPLILNKLQNQKKRFVRPLDNTIMDRKETMTRSNLHQENVLAYLQILLSLAQLIGIAFNSALGMYPVM